MYYFKIDLSGYIMLHPGHLRAIFEILKIMIALDHGFRAEERQTFYVWDHCGKDSVGFGFLLSMSYFEIVKVKD